MRDIASRYAELAAEVDGAGLMGPHDLRRYADRRARARASVLAAAGVVVVAGTTAGGVALLDRPSPQPSPGKTPPATASPSPTPVGPSPSPSAPPPSTTTPPSLSSPQPSEEQTMIEPATSVPERAFFQLPETMRKDTTRVATTPEEALPPFCQDAFAADDKVTARRSVYSAYQSPGTPVEYTPLATMHQTITAYRDGGAEEFMDRLRAIAANCHTFDQGDVEVTFEVLDPPPAGDDAIYLLRTWPATGETNPSPSQARIVVIRVGDVVTVLFDRGWENADSDPVYVARLIPLAVGAIEDWR
jgi:hypothetical protein